MNGCDANDYDRGYARDDARFQLMAGAFQSNTSIMH